MDTAHSRNRIGSFSVLSRRIREIPSFARKRWSDRQSRHIAVKPPVAWSKRIPPAAKKRALGGVFLALSLPLGVWANHLSTDQALQQWSRTHSPSKRIWTRALQDLGFRPVHDPKVLQSLLRTIPVSVDSVGSAWSNPDFTWIAVTDSLAGGDSDTAITAFCLDCGAPPKAWEPAGSGWTGFDSLFAQIDKMLGRRKLKKRAHQAVYVDSREIRY